MPNDLDSRGHGTPFIMLHLSVRLKNMSLPSPHFDKDTPLDGPIIERVSLVRQITRTEPMTFTASSLPGHLIHVVQSGRVEQVALGRSQEITAGTVVWYHENESIEGQIREAPWTFYTVNFHAPTLPPPPQGHRVIPNQTEAIPIAQALLDAWNDTCLSPTTRHLQVHARLLDLLVQVYPEVPAEHRIDRSASLWWQIEAKLRRDLSQPIDLQMLERVAGYSQRQISQACRAACNMTPMRRVKEVRLDYARGLVFFSQQTFSEIAMQVGYSRVQEFSRDYHRRFERTPTEDREIGPEL